MIRGTFLAWDAVQGDFTLVYHDMTFSSDMKMKHISRFDESHFQRTFDEKDIFVLVNSSWFLNMLKHLLILI